MGTGSFQGVKRPGRGVDHPSTSGAEVEGRVELYICSTSGSSWPVIKWPLSLPQHICCFIFFYISHQLFLGGLGSCPVEGSVIRSSRLWETGSCSATKELAKILYNQELLLTCHKYLSTVHILNHTNLVLATPSKFFKIYFIVVLPSTSRSFEFSLFCKFPKINFSTHSTGNIW